MEQHILESAEVSEHLLAPAPHEHSAEGARSGQAERKSKDSESPASDA